MRRVSILTSALIGVGLIAALLSILLLAHTAFDAPFPPFALFEQVVRVLPGPVVTFGIDTMVGVIRGLNLGRTDTVAKLAEQIIAILQMAGLGTLLTVVYFVAVQRVNRSGGDSVSRGHVYALALGVGMVTLLILFPRLFVSDPSLAGMLWVALALLGWGVAHGIIHARLAGSEPAAANAISPTSVVPIPALAEPVAVSPDLQLVNRRQFLVQLGGATALVTVVGSGLSAWLAAARTVNDIGASAPVAINPAKPGDFAAPGTRAELTPLDQHYRIDINVGSGPDIDGSTYALDIKGLVDNPARLTLEELRQNFESMDQIITMSCISNNVGGDLISTIKWTGISMQDLVKRVNPMTNATHIRINGADGFSEILALDVIREDRSVMLAYAWEDQPLKQQHGFPLRIHIPNRYGMKQPKWIASMEFIDKWEPGYWVSRGWDAEALVRTTSVIDTVATGSAFAEGDKQFIPIGGIAWSGTRGISKVEVKIDEGEWRPAELKAPQSTKTWVLWRYDWEFQSGSHTVSVRCAEADGTPQIEGFADVRPSGATGIHTKRAYV